MNNIKDAIYEAFNKNDYKGCIKLIDNLVDNGYGVDNYIIFYYIYSLTRIREYDKAYELTKWFEQYGKGKVNEQLYHLYLYCHKPEEAERIVKKVPFNLVKKETLIRIYLMEGKIDKAKRLLDNILKYEESEGLHRLKAKIDNYYKFDAFIEMDYEPFVKQDRKLKPGHIVFLKKQPDSKLEIESDNKSANRPYMIWQCEGDKVYLFPVTTAEKQGFYKLYRQNYPNSVGDRTVKDRVCYTTKDNILSVCDKVHEDDLKPILKTIYNKMYLSRSKKTRELNDAFMKGYQKPINKYDVIVLVDRNNLNKSYKFVCGCNKDGSYKVIDVDKELNVKNLNIESFRDNRLIYDAIKLSQEEKERIKEQIPKYIIYDTLIGAKIRTRDGRYIVLNENKEKCACIPTIHSPSYINIEHIKKDEIKEIESFIDEISFNNLNEMIERNAKPNTKALIKKLGK